MPLSAIGRKVLLSHGKQIEIAERLGVSVSYVSMVANGKRLPRSGKGRQVQVAIARALRMKVSEAFAELHQQTPSHASHHYITG
jgi:transcriptional regulator with XRE-family HTH domain